MKIFGKTKDKIDTDFSPDNVIKQDIGKTIETHTKTEETIIEKDNIETTPMDKEILILTKIKPLNKNFISNFLIGLGEQQEEKNIELMEFKIEKPIE